MITEHLPTVTMGKNRNRTKIRKPQDNMEERSPNKVDQAASYSTSLLPSRSNLMAKVPTPNVRAINGDSKPSPQLDAIISDPSRTPLVTGGNGDSIISSASEQSEHKIDLESRPVQRQLTPLIWHRWSLYWTYDGFRVFFSALHRAFWGPRQADLFMTLCLASAMVFATYVALEFLLNSMPVAHAHSLASDAYCNLIYLEASKPIITIPPTTCLTYNTTRETYYSSITNGSIEWKMGTISLGRFGESTAKTSEKTRMISVSSATLESITTPSVTSIYSSLMSLRMHATSVTTSIVTSASRTPLVRRTIMSQVLRKQHISPLLPTSSSHLAKRPLRPWLSASIATASAGSATANMLPYVHYTTTKSDVFTVSLPDPEEAFGKTEVTVTNRITDGSPNIMTTLALPRNAMVPEAVSSSLSSLNPANPTFVSSLESSIHSSPWYPKSSITRHSRSLNPQSSYQASVEVIVSLYSVLPWETSAVDDFASAPTMSFISRSAITSSRSNNRTTGPTAVSSLGKSQSSRTSLSRSPSTNTALYSRTERSSSSSDPVLTTTQFEMFSSMATHPFQTSSTLKSGSSLVLSVPTSTLTLVATSIATSPTFTGTSASTDTDGAAISEARGLVTRIISYADIAIVFAFPTPQITTTKSYWTGEFPTVTGPLPSDLQTILQTTRSIRQRPLSVPPAFEHPKPNLPSFTTVVTSAVEDGQRNVRRSAEVQIDEGHLAITVPDDMAVQSELSSFEAPGPASCGESGNFTLNFDDTVVGTNGDDMLMVNGLKNPYHHLFYANGYTDVPDKWEPYPALSQPNVAMFLPLTGSLVSNQPFAGTLLPGEIGAGPRASVRAYWFNAYSGYFGCALSGLTPCVLRISGYRYDAILKEEVLVAEQNATIAACWGYIGCRLQLVVFNNEFHALSGIQFNAYTAGLGIPQVHMMDDLQMEWYDNSCSAGIMRIGHR